jgi:molybdate transport system substrate-binding protein
MKSLKANIINVLLILLLIIVTGCSASDPAPKQELTVAAASSLTGAFTEMGKKFEEDNHCIVTFSFGSTGNLSEQIVNGAPFDVFAAADVSSVDDLGTKDFLLPHTNHVFTVGQIGIATLKDGTAQAQTIEDLLSPTIKKIAIASPEHAPYGSAAKQALMKAGVWDKLEPKLVYGKNISEALTLVTTGNAEAGFIALSLKNDNLNFSLIDAEMHAPLSQAMAIVKNTKQEDLAKKFLGYVTSKNGQEIMSEYGFLPPDEE